MHPRFFILGFLALAAACGSDATSGPSSTARILEAGWSFGFCLGPCRGDLTLNGAALSYVIRSRDGSEALSTHGGELTGTGIARLETAAAALPDDLAERYGCPDCADGGAAYVVVQRDPGSAANRIEYEYGSPPPQLASLDAFLKAVMEALASCEPSEDVRPAADCEPFVP